MPSLPTRTIANTKAEHVSDHNALKDYYNDTGGDPAQIARRDVDNTFAGAAKFKGHPWHDVDAYGTLGTADDTAVIQAAIDAISLVNPASDLGEGEVFIGGTDRTIFVEGTITVPRRTKLRLGDGVELRRVTATAGPVVRLQANSSRLIGGKVRSDVAIAAGIVGIGPATTGNVQWCLIEDVDIHGPGAAVAGSVGLRLHGSTTFQNVAGSGTVIHDVETGVLNEVGANLNEFHGVQMYNIGLRPWHLKASQWRIVGGSISSSANVTVLTLEACFKGYVLGLSAEPGGTSTGYSIDATSDRNVLILGMNTSVVGTDAGTRNIIIDKGQMAAEIFKALVTAGDFGFDLQAVGAANPALRLQITAGGVGQIAFGHGAAGATVTLRKSSTQDQLICDDSFRVVVDCELDGALDHDGTTVGFYGTTPIAKQTGVAVTAAGIHAALVALGLISA